MPPSAAVGATHRARASTALAALADAFGRLGTRVRLRQPIECLIVASDVLTDRPTVSGIGQSAEGPNGGREQSVVDTRPYGDRIEHSRVSARARPAHSMPLSACMFAHLW